ncbi:hypothetical protein [Enterovibrio norvegicus]|uniref:hypothetical protein n=1 Tax=Enterovibrio norvegicus TaxID=188144 RepID=UPI00352DE69A
MLKAIVFILLLVSAFSLYGTNLGFIALTSSGVNSGLLIDTFVKFGMFTLFLGLAIGVSLGFLAQKYAD